MDLPNGVVYRPRQAKLIAKDGVGIISIDSTIAGNADYRIEERTLGGSGDRYLKGDWDDFDRLFRLRTSDSDGGGSQIVYSTAIHDGHPRQPNITVVRNLTTYEQRGVPRQMTVLGCTISRAYPRSDTGPGVAKIYEFLSYGFMLLDSGRGRVDLWIGRAGDKVVVPGGVSASLYNIGDEGNPLLALDFTSGKPLDAAQRETAEAMAREIGPMLLAYYDDLEVVFTINTMHINYSDLAGIRVAPAVLAEYGRTVVLPRTSRQDLGSFIYDQFVHNPAFVARFAKFGINVLHPRGDAVLAASDARSASKLFFSRSLAKAVIPGTKVHRFFFRDTELSEPPSPVGEPPLPLEEEAPPPRVVAARLDRPLVIVVEGAGDWVENAYRPLFKEKAQNSRLSVFYADDTSWKPRPDWAKKDLRPWEIYLDKNNPDDALRYAQLRPDAVFIVTPDFTHSATARYWLDKTPLVFVEKPFDANIQNVEGLQFSFARRPRTEVIGLDHYQFYAQPLKRLQSQIDRHVGRSLASVEFVLAEAKALEIDRVRSLQHGLALDLLPHLIALLTFFGDIRTIDEITIPKVWRYEPLDAYSTKKPIKKKNVELEFQNETGALVEFTFEDRSGSGYRVPCRAVVGKGFERDTKYMEIRGTAGASLRIDLMTKVGDEPKKKYPGYKWGSLFFIDDLRRGSRGASSADPHRRRSDLHLLKNEQGNEIVEPLERRYNSLLDDLLEGTETASASSLSMSQGGHIVRVLDRIWWAIQQSKPWQTHELHGLDAVEALR